ncbi:MAG: acyl-CoA dehydrogenase family protein [Burkholderiaceae bacterium]
MFGYTPPLRDYRFVIEQVLDLPARWAEMPAFADVDADTAGAVLEEAGKFAAGVLAPINASGDLEGCTLTDDEVRTPTGYPAAYQAFVDGGWGGLACDPDDGGQGLPESLNVALNEMMAAANHGWVMYPGLLHGAYACIKAHGSAELKERYLARVASGEWLATMNLTEPQAGSDLGQLRTRAEAQADGSFRISGNKIFISGGEHDMSPNIVHLVLARLPDAPPGTKGISLFLAPKFLPDGTRNAIRCTGIEKKMGIKGSATCAMSFDAATAWLIGEPNRGLAAMFVMMNSARLHVAMQGQGHLDTAQRHAHTYALERVQGRGRPIAEHPAVRRILWKLRALAEGQRVLALWMAHMIDESHHHPDAGQRQRADAMVGLLTPVAKAMFTANGHRGADEALQIWGGYGFVHETGIEQIVRDSRIAMIYEGTNEIQAIDLVVRKVLGDGGANLDALLSLLEADTGGDDAHAQALASHVTLARRATAALVAAQADDAEAPLRVADDYLEAFGLLLLGWAWLRCARAAAAGSAVDAWYGERVQSARFGLQWLLPPSAQLWQRVVDTSALDLPALPAS